jgi:hypothetical protein
MVKRISDLLGIKGKGKPVIDDLILSGILIAISFLFSFTISNFKGGFLLPEITGIYSFYNPILPASLIIIFIFTIIELFVKKGDDKYGSGLGFSSLGDNPHFKLFSRFTIPQITLLFLILFMMLFFFVSIGGKQTTYTGVGFLEQQQFTPLDNIIFTNSFVPIIENLAFEAVFVLIIFFTRLTFRRNNWNPTLFILVCFLLAIFGGGLVGAVWHNTVYSTSEVALLTTAFFWAIGGFLTMATGLFTPFWMMHLTNNLLYSLSRYLSSDLFKIVIISSIIGLIVLYIFVYRGRLLGVKQKPII